MTCRRGLGALDGLVRIHRELFFRVERNNPNHPTLWACRLTRTSDPHAAPLRSTSTTRCVHRALNVGGTVYPITSDALRVKQSPRAITYADRTFRLFVAFQLASTLVGPSRHRRHHARPYELLPSAAARHMPHGEGLDVVTARSIRCGVELDVHDTYPVPGDEVGFDWIRDCSKTSTTRRWIFDRPDFVRHDVPARTRRSGILGYWKSPLNLICRA